MNKIISIVGKILFIILIAIFVAIGIKAGIYQKELLDGVDFIEAIKVDAKFAVKIFGPLILFSLISAIVIKILSSILNTEPNEFFSGLPLLSRFSYISYFITLSYFIITQGWGETHNILLLIFMWIVCIIEHTYPLLFIILLIVMFSGASDSDFSSSTSSSIPSNTPKTKHITANTIQWCDWWSTTTYRDENGNETKVDHWKW